MQDTTEDDGDETPTAQAASNDSGIGQSNCMSSLSTFEGIYMQLKATINSDVQYYASLKAKGNGEGSNAGFQLSKMAKYSDLAVAGFDFYNNCNLDYYSMAVGFNTQSMSGLMNFGTNIYWRMTTEEPTIDNLVTGLTAKNPVMVGNAVGTFWKNLLAVEIPDMNSSGLSNYQVVTQ